MNIVDFRADVRARSERFATRLEHLETEEATKHSLVLPFLEMMGYHIYDPTAVRPEYTADVGTKKGEKVDYAILQDNKPVILIECKKYRAPLAANEANQLLRYFGPTKTARIGILTDGITYKFFSDLQAPNTMDDTPFFEFNMLKANDEQVSELFRFTKDEFSTDEVVDTARGLREKGKVKRFLEGELVNPSQPFVRFVVEQVHEGRRTQAVQERYERNIKEALRQYIAERIESRLQSAADAEREPPPQAEPAPEVEAAAGASAPVAVERDALLIIKGIVRDLIGDVRRLHLRSLTKYCAVLLDDTIRQPVCRLYLREATLRIGFLDEKRHEERVDLEDLDSLYDHAQRLRDAVGRYLAAPAGAEASES